MYFKSVKPQHRFSEEAIPLRDFAPATVSVFYGPEPHLAVIFHGHPDTTTEKGTPYAVVGGITPQEARELAQKLTAAADRAEAGPADVSFDEDGFMRLKVKGLGTVAERADFRRFLRGMDK